MKKLLFLFLITLYVLLPLSACSAHKEMARTDSIAPIDSLSLDTLSSETDSLSLGIDSLKSLPERIRSLLDNPIFERTQVGIYVYDLTADTLVFAYNERQCMRPASNEKLLTAITALDCLGTDYLLRTHMYIDRMAADSDSVYRGHIYIRGGYDPMFDTEDMKAFVAFLSDKGIKRIDNPIAFDLSFKDDNRLGWGWCWDDKAVPLTPLLFNNKNTFAEHLRSCVRDAGIEWGGETTEQSVPDSLSAVCVRSHNIDQILLPVMKNSDNSMAEALFYQIAAKNGGKRVGRKQAVKHYDALILRMGLTPSHYQIADGSGLSLYNYATPELLGKALRYAYANENIFRHLEPSLPIAGVDGSLRKRMRYTKAADNVKAKTGTVEGISTLSGYLTTATGNRLCFSIMNQGIRYTSTGRNFQDRVCTALCQ